MPDKLSTYHAKRNFRITPEPEGEVSPSGERLRFVVQKHDARHLHYDFRLEIDGTLKSWAIPKGPSLDPADKRLAVHVEDHPLGYIDFEGDIPAHQYGAGHVEVWDIGHWEPVGDPVRGYQAGKLKFRLDGEKLGGGWTLLRTRLKGSGGKEQWLLIKERDEIARPAQEYDITEALPDSVLHDARPGKGKRRATNDAHLQSKPAAKADGAPLRKERKPRATARGKSPMPDFIAPQLATLVDEVPQDGEWQYEIKYDGYRLLARIDGDDVRLLTRDGKDWTARMPQHAKALRSLGLESAWLDGEIVVLDKQGVPSFQLLQNAFDKKNQTPIVYFLFDLLYLNGHDMRGMPLRDRRSLLADVMTRAPAELLRFSEPMAQPPRQLLDSACQLSMEGIIGKLVDSTYAGKRSPTWIKLKCRRRQEFVIAGYTEPQGARKYFGALLLGVYDGGKLRYAGRVGTGFDREVLAATYKRLRSLEQDERPFDHMPPGVRRAETHWIRPTLIAEVSFAEWTDIGLVRQAVFHGLREDKAAREIRREEAASVQVHQHQPKAGKRSGGAGATARIEGVAISHPDRVIDAESGATKLDVALYYQRVAPYLLPFLHERPVYLLRCPEGIAGEHFFQKHINRLAIAGIRKLDPSLDPGHAPLMAIDDAHALAGAAQMGSIELHTCSATADRIERPDCMVFDLDPDPALPWSKVVEGARLICVMLDELGLTSFLKTSGGKGLHLVVPLSRRHSWDDVTAFSQAVAEHLARTLPKLFSARMGGQNRVGRIFIDYMRNRRHASTVAPYSLRARPGMGVAVPIGWEELDGIAGAAAWTIRTLPDRLETMKNDPWQDYFKTRQNLTAAMKDKLGIGKIRKK
ncbi:DNA ligase D [Noviherbaspirillum aerium]|uniref:DNA ligase D n=1 Tax=Noviherbaspirillum aerium TaxID=2588497 RepID=UPI00124DE15A|nr:DNA ligase D [Noviherbaspirillum aerium]